MSKNWQKDSSKILTKKSNFSLVLNFEFKALHYIRNYFPDGSDEKEHTHLWKMELEIKSKKSMPPKNGILIDFMTIKPIVNKTISKLELSSINEHKDFKKINPSTENLCLWFYKELKNDLKQKGAILKRISLWEGKNNRAVLNL